MSSLDVLVVASVRDHEIAAQCLINLGAYFPALNQIYLATDQLARGRELVASVGMHDATVVPDECLLSEREMALPGWYRQQIIKLRAGQVLTGQNLCVLSGDTLLARPIGYGDLVAANGRPYLYVNRYRYRSSHLEYERRRIRAVASLLSVTPGISLRLGDFISDLICFERTVLDALTRRLEDGFGPAWTDMLAERTVEPCDQERFGEYSLYAVTALELMPQRPPVRIGCETHVLQLHSRRSFELARFDAAAVHIVDKTLSLAEVAARASRFGQNLLPQSGGAFL